MVLFVEQFMESVRECQQMYGRLSFLLDRLKELSKMFREITSSTGSQRNADNQLPPEVRFGIVRRARTIGRSTKRAALRQMALIDNEGIQIMLRFWIALLNQTPVAPRVADMLEMVSGRMTLDQINQRASGAPLLGQ